MNFYNFTATNNCLKKLNLTSLDTLGKRIFTTCFTLSYWSLAESCFLFCDTWEVFLNTQQIFKPMKLWKTTIYSNVEIYIHLKKDWFVYHKKITKKLNWRLNFCSIKHIDNNKKI